MKAELTDISECKKSLDIEIPGDIVEHEIAHIAHDIAKRAKVPGFRPGKAPAPVVKTRYREEIASRMMEHLLPKYFLDAAQQRSLAIVDEPSYENIEYADGQPLKFKAVFEVFPKLEITNYSGIPADAISTAVEDAEVDATLRKLQEDMSELSPLEEERTVRAGDFVEISFSSTGEEPGQETITAEKALVEIGGASTLSEFTENLTGAAINEDRTFSVTYRDNYPEKRLAGRTVSYRAKVEAIKEKKLPELNDEFAQGLGEYASLEALRSKVREDMERHKRERAKDELRDKLLQWLEDNNAFEVPDALVERQVQVRMHRLIRDLSRQGIDAERLDIDWGRIRGDQYQQSIRDVKGSLILDYVAERENLKVTGEEIEGEIERIAGETNRPAERVREVLSRDSGLDRLERQIRNRKTLDFIQEHARIQPQGSVE